MTERRLAELMRETPLPDSEAAEERTWRVVRAAAVERPAPGPRRRAWAPLYAAAAVLVAALALSPAGAAVADWLQAAVKPGRPEARPSLTSLPAPGRLLVVSADGAWLVRPDGFRRRLGAYDDARWSPRGLFVVATRGRELVALEPGGVERWSLARTEPIHSPAWSPDGFRIAYLSGRSLRVVAGDGSGDRRLRARVAATGPAWRPGSVRRLTYADRRGRIATLDPDSGSRLWRSQPGPPVRRLAWSADGRRLVALTAGSLRILSQRGRLLAERPFGVGERGTAMAVEPSGDSVAVAVHDSDGRSRIDSVPLRGAHPRLRRLFAGDGTFTDLSWSPNGRWLLVAWREADQWVFLRSAQVRKLDAVAGITRHFGPGASGPLTFPRIGGWCCSG